MAVTRWTRTMALAAMIAPPCLAFSPSPVAAQTDPASPRTAEVRATVRVSPVILAEPEIETQLSIQVGPESAIPRQTFVRIRGLPQSARLSDGHVVSPGVWAIPLSALPSLRLTAPLSSSGRSDINLALVTVDGNVLSEVRSSLVVAPAWLLGSSGPRADRQPVLAPIEPAAQTLVVKAPPPADAIAKLQPAPAPAAAPVPTPAPPAAPAAVAPVPAAPAPAAAPAATPPAAIVAALPPSAPAPAPTLAPPPAPVAPSASANAPPPKKVATEISAADKARAESMILRGDTYMNQGNYAAARQFFRIAAELGHPIGAMRLGTTFDPIELATTSIIGLQPDPKQAAIWYEKARSLGAADAAQRLSRLPAAK